MSALRCMSLYGTRMIVFAGFAIISTNCSVKAQNNVAVDPSPIVFRLAKDVLPAGGVQLANGVKVVPQDWAAIILAQIPRSSDPTGSQSACSGTLVGPNVALMAGHCVDAMFAPVRKAVIEMDGGRISLDCEIHPDYMKRDRKIMSPRGSEDYALCLMKLGPTVPQSLGSIDFEVLDVNNVLEKGEPVLMTGYGCSEMHVEHGAIKFTQSDSTLRIKDGVIETAPKKLRDDPAYVAIRSKDNAGGALCKGDSGGPLLSGASEQAQDGPRRVRGVNSAVDFVSNADGGHDFISSIAVTGIPEFRKWVKSWLERNKTSKPVICGINKKGGDYPCRK